MEFASQHFIGPELGVKFAIRLLAGFWSPHMYTNWYSATRCADKCYRIHDLILMKVFCIKTTWFV